MQTILIVFHLFLALALIGLILIQHGKGADMGAAFGSGASGTVFGAKGSASFLTRLTAGLATLFFVTSMVMAYFASQSDDGNFVLDTLPQTEVEAETQPTTDLPPMPAGSDVPAVPVEGGEEALAPQTDVPVVAAPDNADVPAVAAPDNADVPAVAAPDNADAPAVSAEAPATETTEAAPATPEAPAEAKE
ncbi:MAG: preprotein translocase subunit SecG [Chromatiales bacterium]|jgi:preprotein translocase subunit SecG